MMKRKYFLIVFNVLASLIIGLVGIKNVLPYNDWSLNTPVMLLSALVGTTLPLYFLRFKDQQKTNFFLGIIVIVLFFIYYIGFGHSSLDEDWEVVVVYGLLLIIVSIVFYFFTITMMYLFLRASFTLLYLSAAPFDEARIRNEFDTIVECIRIGLAKIKIQPPYVETNLRKLITGLSYKPQILHFSGHGDKNGICLIDDETGNTQYVTNDVLKKTFEKHESVKLIFVNSCFSKEQAALISNMGIYFIGLNEAVGDSVATELARDFYTGFATQKKPVSLKQGLVSGLELVDFNSAKRACLISLWENGKEIDVKFFIERSKKEKF